MSRRQFLRRSLGASLALAVSAACTPAPAASPTAPPAASRAEAQATTAAKPADQPSGGPPGESAKPAAPAAAVKPTAQGDRLVVAFLTWGNEQPFTWDADGFSRPLWEPIYDSLINRDPQTFEARPGLATEWKPSADYRSWTLKLRQGVMFHDNYGELTAEDIKFSLEQHLKANATGGSAPYFKDQLERVDAADPYTVVIHLKNPSWEVPAQFTPPGLNSGTVGSKKYIETVGEDKARQHPIGTGPYRFVEGRQGEFYRFEAVPNHWRVTPGFRELVFRRIPDQAARLSALRAGEIDIGQFTGDYLAQVKQAGLRVHEVKGVMQYIISLANMTLPDKPDYCPTCPWSGDLDDPKSVENAKKVRLALNLAVDKQAIVNSLWQGYAAIEPFVPSFFPFHKGFRKEWQVHPYDPQRAKQLLAEAGYPNGFEIDVTNANYVPDGPDVMEAVALDWEKVGIKVKRRTEDVGTFNPKLRTRKGVTAYPFGNPAYEEPALGWQRLGWSKGSFYTQGESPEYDRALEAIFREMDAEKRVQMQVDLAQKRYDDHRVVMLGVKSATWGLSKKVGDWPTIPATRFETHLEYATPAAQ